MSINTAFFALDSFALISSTEQHHVFFIRAQLFRQLNSIYNMEHPVFKYFNYIEKDDRSICRFEECSFPMKGKHASNLVSHIKKKHQDVFPELKKAMDDNALKRTAKPKKKSDSVMVLINRDEIIKGCVELVTVNARPNTMLQDSGFKRILNPITTALNLSLNNEFIDDQAKEVVQSMKEKISTEIGESVLCLKIDLLTSFGRKFIGITAQYFLNNTLVDRALALKRITQDSSGIVLAEMVTNVLESYNLNIDKVYTMTTDCGGNVLKCVEVMKVFQEHTLDVYLDFDQTLDSDVFQQLIDNEIKRMAGCSENKNFLFGAKCTAHVTELTFDDAFKACGWKTKIEKFRTLVKKLRSFHIVNLLKTKKLKLAILDGDTRWITSTYKMVNKYLKFKLNQ